MNCHSQGVIFDGAEALHHFTTEGAGEQHAWGHDHFCPLSMPRGSLGSLLPLSSPLADALPKAVDISMSLPPRQVKTHGRNHICWRPAGLSRMPHDEGPRGSGGSKQDLCMRPKGSPWVLAAKPPAFLKTCHRHRCG